MKKKGLFIAAGVLVGAIASTIGVLYYLDKKNKKNKTVTYEDLKHKLVEQNKESEAVAEVNDILETPTVKVNVQGEPVEFNNKQYDSSILHEAVVKSISSTPNLELMTFGDPSTEYFITSEQYENEEYNGYKTEDLTLYVGNKNGNVLVDAYENVVSLSIEVMDQLESYKEESEEFLYVRNDDDETDYRIDICARKFEDY